MRFKKVIVYVVSVMCCLSSVSTQAVSNDSGGQIAVTVEPLLISATVPTQVTAVIDPNKKIIDYEGNQATDTEDTFISPSFTIESNCNAPLKVKIKEITPVVGTSPNVVVHDTYTDAEWKKLNKSQTNKNIAYGFIMDDTSEWQRVGTENGWFDPNALYEFGALSGHSRANIHLKSKYGFAFGNSQREVLNYSIVYELSLE